MEEVIQQRKLSRRILLVPALLTGHINPLLLLATLLYSKDFSITIIQIHYNSITPVHFPHFTFHILDDSFLDTYIKSPDADTYTVLSTMNNRRTEPFWGCLSQILLDAANQEPSAALIADLYMRLLGLSPLALTNGIKLYFFWIFLISFQTEENVP